MNFAGPDAYRAGAAAFEYRDAQPDDTFALDGDWTVRTQFAEPSGSGAAGIRLSYRAAEVRMVLAGTGELRVTRADGSTETIAVDGTPRSYAVVDGEEIGAGVLEVQVDPGVQVYSFTFG